MNTSEGPVRHDDHMVSGDGFLGYECHHVVDRRKEPRRNAARGELIDQLTLR